MVLWPDLVWHRASGEKRQNKRGLTAEHKWNQWRILQGKQFFNYSLEAAWGGETAAAPACSSALCSWTWCCPRVPQPCFGWTWSLREAAEALLKLQSGSIGVFGMMNELSFLRWADWLKFPQHDSEKQRRIFLNEAALITLIQHFCFKSSDWHI